MVELGDKVRDTVTGFTGIAVCKSIYLQGCDRVAVQAPVIKNETPQEWVYIDEPILEVLKKQAIKQSPDSKLVGGWKPDNAKKPF